MKITIPEFELPNFLARLGECLPQWPHSVSLCTVLNILAKANILPEDSLNLLEDKIFLLSVNDTGARARFTYRKGLFHPVLKQDRAPDLSFRANLAAYMQLINRQEDPDTLFFQRRLAVEGDTELGLTVKNMLDAIDWPLSLPGSYSRSPIK